MLPMGAIVNAADNSGAKRIQLVNIPGGRKKLATIGDTVTAVVLGADSAGYVKDHTVVQVIIVRTRKEVRRKDGSYIRFDDNAAVVMNKDGDMVATRIFGPIAREIRDLGYLKVASLAKEVW